MLKIVVSVAVVAYAALVLANRNPSLSSSDMSLPPQAVVSNDVILGPEIILKEADIGP